MNRVLVIDADREAARTLALGCLESGTPLRVAETVCEGVRCLLDVPVSLIVVDAAVLRRTGAEQMGLFAAVAPGVPLVAAVSDATPVEERVRLEVAGYRVEAKPVDLVQVLAKTAVAARRPRGAGDAGRRVRLGCGA